MNKFSILAGGAALAMAAMPATAPAKPKPKPTKYCMPHVVGFEAVGKYVSGSLTQSAGAGTAKKSDDRWSGTITVDVKKANHGAPKGTQTYTVTNARVRIHPAKYTAPAAGDRVKVSGKLTKVSGKNCTNPGVTSQVARKIDVKAAAKNH